MSLISLFFRLATFIENQLNNFEMYENIWFMLADQNSGSPEYWMCD